VLSRGGRRHWHYLVTLVAAGRCARRGADGGWQTISRLTLLAKDLHRGGAGSSRIRSSSACDRASRGTDDGRERFLLVAVAWCWDADRAAASGAALCTACPDAAHIAAARYVTSARSSVCKSAPSFPAATTEHMRRFW